MEEKKVEEQTSDCGQAWQKNCITNRFSVQGLTEKVLSKILKKENNQTTAEIYKNFIGRENNEINNPKAGMFLMCELKRGWCVCTSEWWTQKQR